MKRTENDECSDTTPCGVCAGKYTIIHAMAENGLHAACVHYGTTMTVRDLIDLRRETLHALRVKIGGEKCKTISRLMDVSILIDSAELTFQFVGLWCCLSWCCRLCQATVSKDY